MLPDRKRTRIQTQSAAVDNVCNFERVQHLLMTSFMLCDA